MKTLFLSLAFLAAAAAEVRTMTLREAVAVALKQNPDLVVARFDEVRARYATLAKRRHPDVEGGSVDAMVELTEARDEAVRSLEG